MGAIASPQNFYYQQQQHPNFYGASSPYTAVGAISPYANAVVPAVAVAPVPSTVTLAPEHAAMFKQLAKTGSPYLVKASEMLQTLMKGLPTALSQMEPATRSDMGKVNQIIAEVCSNILSQSQPSTNSYYKVNAYYKAEDLKTTCDYINKVGNDILAGMDNPSIIQSYVDQLQAATNSLIAEA